MKTRFYHILILVLICFSAFSQSPNDGIVPPVGGKTKLQLSEQARQSKQPFQFLITDVNKKIKYWQKDSVFVFFKKNVDSLINHYNDTVTKGGIPCRDSVWKVVDTIFHQNVFCNIQKITMSSSKTNGFFQLTTLADTSLYTTQAQTQCPSPSFAKLDSCNISYLFIYDCNASNWFKYKTPNIYTAGKTLFVDEITGNDATAKKGCPTCAWKHPLVAVNTALTDELIKVENGTYDFTTYTNRLGVDEKYLSYDFGSSKILSNGTYLTNTKVGLGNIVGVPPPLKTTLNIEGGNFYGDAQSTALNVFMGAMWNNSEFNASINTIETKGSQNWSILTQANKSSIYVKEISTESYAYATRSQQESVNHQRYFKCDNIISNQLQDYANTGLIGLRNKLFNTTNDVIEIGNIYSTGVPSMCFNFQSDDMGGVNGNGFFSIRANNIVWKNTAQTYDKNTFSDGYKAIIGFFGAANRNSNYLKRSKFDYDIKNITTTGLVIAVNGTYQSDSSTININVGNSVSDITSIYLNPNLKNKSIIHIKGNFISKTGPCIVIDASLCDASSKIILEGNFETLDPASECVKITGGNGACPIILKGQCKTPSITASCIDLNYNKLFLSGHLLGGLYSIDNTASTPFSCVIAPGSYSNVLTSAIITQLGTGIYVDPNFNF